ncbi:GTP cyclohydrolase II [Tistlia consotensis]|uniref:GTP cyclohydrolase-2 n=1 Tax=Tistlia consotensis USBA 355 TaxID=560819 RepID=A0A1Y6BLU7_9PROT|nr:GTP cyclohydrolase II [Tistlia consotensis]SMF09262.1 GTP cyclohydrolase II [Tistlia consotensis USBA 355]SNR34716.1 GTP cyclohydrolase II [Tistlia consotensis]
MDQHIPTQPSGPEAAHRVQQALAALRRGAAVVVDAADGPLLAAAPECLDEAGLRAFRAQAGRGGLWLACAAWRSPDGPRALEVSGLGAGELLALVDPARSLEELARAQRLAAAPTDADAALELCKLAHLMPAALLASSQLDCPWRVSTGEIAAYAGWVDSALIRVVEARVPLALAEDARIVAFRPRDGGREHLAILVGRPEDQAEPLVRIHSECFTGDLLGSLRCDCGEQLRGALAAMNEAGAGVLLYLAQEGRGIGLVNKLRAYSLQDRGADTLEANEALGFAGDERSYQPAAAMLQALGVGRVRLLTNNPDKLAALAAAGVEVVERVPHSFPSNGHNESYLATKAERFGHLF